jgi:hypothetical protein
MDHMLTVRSSAKDGGLAEIAVEITGKDKAQLTIRQWRKGDPPPPAKPHSTISEKASDIVMSHNLAGITCHVSFATITCALSDAAATTRSIGVTIASIFGEQLNTYPLETSAYDQVKTFFATSGFPVATH